MRRIIRALTSVAAAVTLFALAACGAVGPESGNDDEATATFSGDITCSNIGAELESIGNDVSSAAESAGADPAAFVSELQSALERLGALTEATSDPELKSRLQTVQDKVGNLVDSVTSGEVLSNLGNIETQIGEIITAMDAVDTYCAGAA